MRNASVSPLVVVASIILGLLGPLVVGVTPASAQTYPEWTGDRTQGQIRDGNWHDHTVGANTICNLATDRGQGSTHDLGVPASTWPTPTETAYGQSFQFWGKCNYYQPLGGFPEAVRVSFFGEDWYHHLGACVSFSAEGTIGVDAHFIGDQSPDCENQTQGGIIEHVIANDGTDGNPTSGSFSFAVSAQYQNLNRDPATGCRPSGFGPGLAFFQWGFDLPGCDEIIFTDEMLWPDEVFTLNPINKDAFQAVDFWNADGTQAVHNSPMQLDDMHYSVTNINDFPWPRAHTSFVPPDPIVPATGDSLVNGCTVLTATITDSQTGTLISDPLNGVVPQGFLFRNDRAYDFAVSVDAGGSPAMISVTYDGLVSDEQSPVVDGSTYTFSHTYPREFPYYPVNVSCRTDGAIGLDNVLMVERSENFDSYYFGDYTDVDWLLQLQQCFDEVTPGGGSWTDWVTGTISSTLNPVSWVKSASCVLSWGFVPVTPGHYWTDRLSSDISVSPVRFLTETVTLPFKAARNLDNFDTNECRGPEFTFGPTGTQVAPFDACDPNGIGMLANVVSVGLTATVYLSAGLMCVRIVAGAFGATVPSGGSD